MSRTKRNEPEFFLGQDSHVGYDRLINEDEYGWFSTPNGSLFVVAEGLGDDAGSGVASRLAVAAFRDYLKTPGEPESLLKGAVLAADAAVVGAREKFKELEGLGAALAAILWRKNEAWYVHFGDSRIYLHSVEGLRRLTRDHSALGLSSGPDDEGMKASAADSALGNGVDQKVVRVGHHHCREEDTFLLCTKGLTSLVEDSEIEEILKDQVSPQDRARRLIEAAVRLGGVDNVTVQVLSFKPGKTERRGWFAIMDGQGGWLKRFWPGFACGLLFGAGLIWLWSKFFSG